MGEQDAVCSGLFGQPGVKIVPFPVHLLQVIELAHKLCEIWLVSGGILLGRFVENPYCRHGSQGAPEGSLCTKEASASVTNKFGPDEAASPPVVRQFQRHPASHNAQQSGAGCGRPHD
jgi:hypothetical protein